MENKLAIFESKEIRKVWYNEEWWFVITDIVFALTESKNVSDYLKKLKKRDEELKKVFENKGGGQIVPPLGLEFKTAWWKQKIQCWNTEWIFRLIQSIPSKKAEPFKLWLAKVGYDRVKEIENPELAQDRMKSLYEKKWYTKNWIEKRLRWIAIRQELTDEWKARWIKEWIEYSILTAEISKATFWMTPSEYKDFKNLPEKSKLNLRDNMTDLELIFTMLWEKVTTEISENEKPETFEENKKVANRWWSVARNARIETEKEIGKKVSVDKNYLDWWDSKTKLL